MLVNEKTKMLTDELKLNRLKLFEIVSIWRRILFQFLRLAFVKLVHYRGICIRDIDYN